jgi:hypothetical protein
MNGDKLNRSGRGPTEIPTQQLLGGAEENDENSQ